MKKILMLFLILCPVIFAQETSKEEAKNDANKEPIKLPAKEVEREKEIAKVVQESKIFWDDEKTKIKILASFYIKDGKEIPHGVSKSFFENGKVYTERNFKDGSQDGAEIIYNKDGTKEHSSVWKMGEVIKDMSYFLTGTMKSETELKTVMIRNSDASKPDIPNAIRHGVEKIFYVKSGKLKIKMDWNEDVQDGLETYYYESGSKKYELTWKKGVKNGIYSEWWENGTLASVLNYVDDKAQGEMTSYHENGKKKDFIEWDKDVIINDRISWNDKGDLIAKCAFKKGKPFKGTLYDNERDLIIYYEDGNQVDSKVCDKNGILKEKK